MKTKRFNRVISQTFQDKIISDPQKDKCQASRNDLAFKLLIAAVSESREEDYFVRMLINY